ncbi:hypothetical protein Tco_1155908 [Tanacetum coccineum]
MAIPKEHLRRFHGMDDAKKIWEAIRTRFGGNANSKKMQKVVLKQQFKAFTISSSEGLEKGYDRFQQLLSQSEAHGAEVSTEDSKHKFLRFLPSAWSNLAMTIRTKPDVDTLSIDDLYNNLRVFEQELTSTSKSSASAQNVAFVSHSKSSTNKVKFGHTGAYSTYTPFTSSNNIPKREVLAGFADEVIYSLFVKQSEDLDLLHEDLEQIDDLDIEEMDINWQIAMISIRMNKFYKKTGRRVRIDGNKPVGFDKKKLIVFQMSQHWSFLLGELYIEVENDGKDEAVKKGRKLQKIVDSWKDSSKNLWKLVNSGMTSNSKVGLGYGIKSNNEVLSSEEEMNCTVFNCTEEDFVDKPLYNRFFKTALFCHLRSSTSLTGNYTPLITIRKFDVNLCLHVNTVRSRQPVPTSNSNSFSPVRPQYCEGINTGFTDVNTAFKEINSGDESIIPSPKKGQKEGKAVLEEKSQSKRTKKQTREEQASLAEIVRLQAQEEAEYTRKSELERQDALIAKRVQDELELSETQKKRMAQVQEAAKYYTEEDWDSVRAKLEANRDLYMQRLIKFKPDELKVVFDKCVEKVKKVYYYDSELEASEVEENREDEIFNVHIKLSYNVVEAFLDDKWICYNSAESFKWVQSHKDQHLQKLLSGKFLRLTLEAAHIYMLTEVQYPLPSRVCQAMLEKKLIGDRKDEVMRKQYFSKIRVDMVKHAANKGYGYQATISVFVKSWLAHRIMACGKGYGKSIYVVDSLLKTGCDDEASFHEDVSENGTASNKPKQQQLLPTTTTISNIKLPILKKEEYDI